MSVKIEALDVHEPHGLGSTGGAHSRALVEVQGAKLAKALGLDFMAFLMQNHCLNMFNIMKMLDLYGLPNQNLNIA